MTGKRETLASHIQTLCAQHRIDVVERRSRGGWASRRSRTISIKPVKTERTYIVALHEIGHIVGPGRSGRRLEQEAAAWDFVLERSIVPPSRASYAFMLRCLQSYLHRATHARRRMIVPDRGHRFWSTYEVIARRALAADASPSL